MDKISSPTAVLQPVAEEPKQQGPVLKKAVVVGQESDSEITLEKIGEQLAQIKQQVELVQKEVDIMIAMSQIQKQINELASQAEGLNLERNVLSSS
jgi:hypothetical protein